MRRESVEEMIPSLITGTPEERIEKWKVYLNAGICIIRPDADKDEWVDVHELYASDFEMLGFIALEKLDNKSDWNKYEKSDINTSIVTGIKKYITVRVYHNPLSRRVIIAADLEDSAFEQTIFNGTLFTNYEFHILLKQLNIID